MVEVVDADGARRGEPLLDPVPRRMLQVERDAERRVERAEHQLEDAVVAGVLHRDANRAEPVAEHAHA